MMEVLGAAVVGLIVAGAAVIGVSRFLAQGNNSRATGTIATAVAAAQEIHTQVLSTGQSNFAGADISALSSAGDITDAAVQRLNAMGDGLCYYSLVTATASAGGCGPGLGLGDPVAATGRLSVGANLIRDKADTAVWAYVNYDEAWDTGGSARAGQVIRMGTASSSGDTFCAVIVADSTDVDNVGTGYQAITERGADATGWAHCGVHAAVSDRGRFTLGGGGVDALLPAPTDSYDGACPPGETFGTTPDGRDGVAGNTDDTIAYCH